MNDCLKIACLLACTCLFAFVGLPVAAQTPQADADRIADVYSDELQSGLFKRMEQLETDQRRLTELLDGPRDDDGFTDELDPNDPPLPNYVFERTYFNRSGVGARALADYAPPGYEARDQQEGPAKPEFARIDPPEKTTESQQDDFVTQGLFPGSFLAPGTNTSVRFRGFVRLAGLYDFDPIGTPDAFVTNAIPVPQAIGQNFNASGRISRFALETWTPTNFCDWNVHTFIEGDFFNGAGQAAGGGGNPLRLRHAFFDFGYFRFGQQNTAFMDASSWPSLVDFQGPNSWINQRQPSVRMTLPLTDRTYWATSVERPFSDITAVDGAGVSLGSNVQDSPDFATHWRYEGNRGHLQVGGLLRTISFRPTGGQVDSETAAGISSSAVFHPWSWFLCTDPVLDENPSGLTRSRIILQGTWGPGVGRYINDLAGQGLDGQVDPLTGDLQLVDAGGWNASYEHWFNEHWLTSWTFSQVNIDNNIGQRGTTYDSAHYMAASLWWIPVPRLSFAIEYIAGDRENLDGQSADTQRMHVLAQYNF